MIKDRLPGVLILVATSLLAADPGPKPAAPDVTGKWKSEFESPVGHLKYVYQLKANGDKLTGTAFRERDGVKTQTELKEGVIAGDQVSFVEPIKIQDQDVRIEYKGKYRGDEIKFTRKVGEFATTEIVALREKENTASLNGKWKAEFDTQVGQQKYTYEFKVDGEKLTGKAIGESQFGKFDTAISEGKIGPSGFSFVEMLKLPDQEIKIEYNGKLSGDELKMTRKVGDFATEEVLAKRVPDSSAK